MSKGVLFVISAPSGAGKTSLINAMLQTADNMKMSVSHTTRSKRPSEKDGEDYYFVTQDEFKQMRDEGLFIEHAQVFGNYYGTSRQWVVDTLNLGFDVLLEIDWQGAKQIKQNLPGVVSVFIFPPSEEALLARLQARNEDDPDVIARRMLQARNEMSHYVEYDYLIVNDNFEKAHNDLLTICQAAKLKIDHQQDVQKDLIHRLCNSI